MAHITTVMHTHLEQIIVKGELSSDDIHSLSLVDMGFFQAITDPSRAQLLWAKHLPFPSVFLFDRAVRIYAPESDEKGAFYSYSVKKYSGRQLVCRQLVASGNPDLLIAEEVKRWYDLWLSFFVGDRLKTVDDILLFQERHGKNFPDADYQTFFEANKHESGGHPSVYFEVASICRFVLEGVKRFQKGEPDNKYYDTMLKTAVPLMKMGYMSVQDLHQFLYVMGKETVEPGAFFYMRFLLGNIVKNIDKLSDEKRSIYQRGGIVQMHQIYYSFFLYLHAVARVFINRSKSLPDEPADLEPMKMEAIRTLNQLITVPNFSNPVFLSAVSFDYVCRHLETLCTQMTSFKSMLEEGHITFSRLEREYARHAEPSFLISYCTPVFLEVLREKLLSFSILESAIFHRLPFICSLMPQGELQVPEALQRLSNSFLGFLSDVQKKGLQKDFNEFYGILFFLFFIRFSGDVRFDSPYNFFNDYLGFEDDPSSLEDQNLYRFFSAVKKGYFTASLLMSTYQKMVSQIDQIFQRCIESLEIAPENRDLIKNSRPYRALFLRLFIFSFSRHETPNLETIESALLDFVKRFESFCSKIITPANITAISEKDFVQVFKGLYEELLKSNSFLKISITFDKILLEKNETKDNVISTIDALEYMACFIGEGQVRPLEIFKDFTAKVLPFNRRVNELASRYPFAAPQNQLLIDEDLDLDEQLEVFSVLSEQRPVEVYEMITREYYVLMSSVFGDKVALNLVNKMITEGSALKISAYIASGRWTMDQYSDFMLRVLKMAVSIRSRTLLYVTRIEGLIDLCWNVFMNTLSESIIGKKNINFEATERRLKAAFSLQRPEEQVDEADEQDEAA